MVSNCVSSEGMDRSAAPARHHKGRGWVVSAAPRGTLTGGDSSDHMHCCLAHNLETQVDGGPE